MKIDLENSWIAQYLSDCVGDATVPKKIFSKFYKDKKDLLHKREQNITKIEREIRSNLTIPQSSKTIIIYKDKEFPYLLRYNNYKFKWIHNYHIPHLMNSLIKQLIAGNIEQEINTVVYTLYYFSFASTESIQDLGTAVVTDLEEMVSILRAKQNTFYRNVNTENIIRTLTNRTNIERLLKATSTRMGLNFRR